MKKSTLLESNQSDYIAFAGDSATFEEFLGKVKENGLEGELEVDELKKIYIENKPKTKKEGLSTYGDDAYFVVPNKGKMKKEDILKAIKEVLAENTGQLSTITGRTGETEVDVVTPKRKAELEKAGAKITPMEEDLDLGHEDDEPHMIKSELYKVAKYALELYKMVDQFEGKGEVDFPAWWQSKVTKATSMISSAKHYLEFELTEPAMDQAVVGDEMPVAEKLDPVGHEDEDVDNDGKKNTKTDKYLKNRRVKIGQAIASHKK